MGLLDFTKSLVLRATQSFRLRTVGKHLCKRSVQTEKHATIYMLEPCMSVISLVVHCHLWYYLRQAISGK